MVQDTVFNLEAHLRRINEKLSQFDNASISNSSVNLKDEREVTKQCLRICEDASYYIRSLTKQELPLIPKGPHNDTEDIGQTYFKAQTLTSQTLDESRDSFPIIIGKLRKHLESLILKNESIDQSELSHLVSDINTCWQSLEVCKVASEVSTQNINNVIDLEAHLELVNKNLDGIVAKDTKSLRSDFEELQLMNEEQLSFKKCLKIIEHLSWLIEQSQWKRRHGVSTLGMMTDEEPQNIVQQYGQDRLRKAEDLSQGFKSEHDTQFTNEQLYSDLANNERSSSSASFVEELKTNNISPTEKAIHAGNTPENSHPILGVNDYQSDISNPPSVFSLATMPSTNLTTDTRLTADEMRTAIDELVCIFLEDTEIIYLFREAISKLHIASDRLNRNFRRLMKRFATNLKDEAQEAIDLDLANLILSRSSPIAEKIGSRFRQESSRLGAFPESLPEIFGSSGVVFRFAEDIRDVSSDEENDVEEPEIDDRFASLVSHGRSFIAESAAFQKLRLEFRNFLMPTVKPMVLDYSFDSKQWMIRHFWSLAGLLSSIKLREESDLPCLISTRPLARSPPREIVVFSEPIHTDLYSTDLPLSWHSSRYIECLGLCFQLNYILWAIRISWSPPKLFTSFSLREQNSLLQHRVVLLCQPCYQNEPHFESSTHFTWDFMGIESNFDERKRRGRISWDPAELLRSLYLREENIPKHHKRFRWTNVSLCYLADSTNC
jgi:hypothetical protein